ncbi:MAG TPA: pilus assembly protein N-terminal domain-containing protein, partial [bacterium]|nr:pilus assembly protein N-terminal domain-containing protein [bacterium]
MKLSLRSISLALLVLLAGGIITWAAAPDTPIIRIAVGENKVVRFPGGITRVAIGTPGLVSVTITGREEMLLNGTAPGNTTLHIWNDEQQVRQYALHVMTRDQLFISDAEKIQGAYDIGVAAQSDGRILIKGFIRDNSVRTKLLNLAQVYYSEIIDGLLLPGEDAPLTTAMTEGNLTQSDTTVVTKLFSPRSRSANDLNTVLSSMLSGQGKIIVDASTNSLIVIDTPENVETIGRFIKRLDEQTTSQVMIEAKFVELSEAASDALGVNWQLNTTSFRGSTVNINGADVANNLDPTPSLDPSLSHTGGGMAMAINAATGNLKDLAITGLDVRLNAMEKDGSINILSAPSVTTVNGQPASVEIMQNQAYVSGYTYTYNDDGDITSGVPEIATV